MSEEDKIERPPLKRPEILVNSDKKIERPGLKEQFGSGVEKESETAPETQAETPREISEKIGQIAKEDKSSSPAPVYGGHEERERKVEVIMSKGLEDAYLKMSSEKQAEFKQAGEETAKKINELLNKATVKIRKIVDLLKKWLSLLPGVNKFFIEQEAKIRADKISKLKE